MDSLAIVTVVTRNYLHYAHALAKSVRQHEPRAAFWICIADEPGAGYRPPEGCAGVLPASDLGIARWRRFAFQYTPFELSCALKPFAMRHILNNGCSRVAYMDADMQLLAPLDELHRWLDESAIILTPHAHRPVSSAAAAHERTYLSSGTFNAGSLAVRQTATADEFLAWWQAKCERDSIDDVPAGLFVDQKWLNLVPGMFDGVHIARHLGYNAGHWTLPAALPATGPNGRVHFGEFPVVLFHYSGFSPDDPHSISRYQSRYTLDDVPALSPLLFAYADDLAACGRATFEPLGCEFNRLSDGTPINPLWREAIRSDHANFDDLSDPFDVQRTPDIVQRFRRVENAMRHRRESWRIAALEEKVRAGKLRRFTRYLEQIVKGSQAKSRAA
jgi:hypothetical protein